MIILANELRVGMQVAENAGFLFDVAEIVRETFSRITVRLCSDYSSFKEHWTVKPDGTKGELIRRFNKYTLLDVIL